MRLKYQDFYLGSDLAMLEEYQYVIPGTRIIQLAQKSNDPIVEDEYSFNKIYDLSNQKDLKELDQFIKREIIKICDFLYSNAEGKYIHRNILGKVSNKYKEYLIKPIEGLNEISQVTIDKRVWEVIKNGKETF